MTRLYLVVGDYTPQNGQEYGGSECFYVGPDGAKAEQVFEAHQMDEDLDLLRQFSMPMHTRAISPKELIAEVGSPDKSVKSKTRKS